MDVNVALWEKAYTWNSENRNFMIYPDEELVRIIKKKLLPSGVKTVLDLGCGSGRHSLMMATEGLTVTGIDSSTTALELAREMTSPFSKSASFQLANATQPLPFEDAAFDAVVCWGVLHYLTDAEAGQALAEIRRIVKPGGSFALTLRSVADSECHNQGTTLDESAAAESRGMLFRYFDEAGVRERLQGFEEIEIGHKTRSVLGTPDRVIAHWFIHCRTPA